MSNIFWKEKIMLAHTRSLDILEINKLVIDKTILNHSWANSFHNPIPSEKGMQYLIWEQLFNLFSEKIDWFIFFNTIKQIIT